jgi:hypothetical protein
MTILNFVTQDELDDLDEDPRIAFMTLANLAQRSLAEQIKKLDPQEEYQWNQREELRQSFMNVVVAAAKRLEVEPFVSMEVPRLAKFKEPDFLQIKADLDHYVTQLVLDNSIRSKRDSVAILPESKERIRTYVYELRRCVENANMTRPKREALLKNLDQFEAELEKRRLNILAVARVAFELLAIPRRGLGFVMQVVAEAKSAEQEPRQLAPTAPPKALSPPRDEKAVSVPVPVPGGDIDDDIPF